MKKNIIVGWMARLLVILLSFLNTRLILDYVGADGLAAYSIILSLTTWMTLLNLGIPISIQNTISRFRGSGKNYDSVRNHAYGSMVLVMISISPLAMAVGLLAHSILLAEYSFVSNVSVVAACIFLYIAGQSQLLTQVLYAENRAFWPNIYPVFSSVYATLVLLLLTYLNIENFNLLLVILSFGNLIAPMHAYFILDVSRKIKFNISRTLMLIRESKDIFIFSLLSACTLAIDYLIMARALSPLEIVDYNITNRLFGVIIVAYSIVLATNWSQVSELFHASDMGKARQRVKGILKQGLVFGCIFGFIILASMNSIVDIWMGDKVNPISLWLGLACWIYIMIRIWTDTFSMALLAGNRAVKINKCMPFQALISVIGQYVLGSHFGPTGVVIGLTLSFLLTVSWILPGEFYKLTRGWNVKA